MGNNISYLLTGTIFFRAKHKQDMKYVGANELKYMFIKLVYWTILVQYDAFNIVVDFNEEKQI